MGFDRAMRISRFIVARGTLDFHTEPGLGVRPIGIRGRSRYAEGLRRFFEREPGEKAKFHELSLARVFAVKPVQGNVEGDEINRGHSGGHLDVAQLLPVLPAAALEPFLLARPFHENPSHGLGRGGEKMATTVPRRRGALSFDLHEAHVRLVNKGCGLDRLSRRLSSKFLSREPP